MRRPTDFTPVYDQTQEQAAELVESLFRENDVLYAERNFLTCVVLSLKDLIENDNHSTDFLMDTPQYEELIASFENYVPKGN